MPRTPTARAVVLRLILPSEMTFKEFPCPALALLAEHYRLRFASRIGDVPPGVGTFRGIPIVRSPRSQWTRRRQAQQCQNLLVDFAPVVLHGRDPDPILRLSCPAEDSFPGAFADGRPPR